MKPCKKCDKQLSSDYKFDTCSECRKQTPLTNDELNLRLQETEQQFLDDEAMGF